MTVNNKRLELLNRITLTKGDITKQLDVDAIVTTLQTNMDMSGRLNKSLVEAAGENLDEFILENIYQPRVGDVHAVPSFAMGIPYIFVAFTPNWRDGFSREDRDLIRSYRNSIDLARRLCLKKIAFPALGTGRKTYPLDRAARLAIQGIQDRQTGQLDEVRFVCDRDELVRAFGMRLKSLGWTGKVKLDKTA